MKFLLATLLISPLFSAILIRFFSFGSEKFVSKTASLTKLLVGFTTLVLLIQWVLHGFSPFEVNYGQWFVSKNYAFPLVLYIDWASIVFLTLTAFISAIIIRYCRYYLHREEGYARFFMTIFLFIFGMELLITAGDLDLMLAGWEIVGISSFLLIAFYRERVLPVRNALRAYFVYRFCDVGFLLAIWLSHLFWSKGVRFSSLRELRSSEFLAVGTLPLLSFCVLLVLAACGKSAQFPVCFWLPRAMEGPTPSSAIFYGALSIHAGVFLLIRTLPIWICLSSARIAIALVGTLSMVIATLAGRTQSNVKGQLGYASIAQVGIILIELAFNLPKLALFHTVTNACLRCYQLLVSPSVVAQVLRLQGTVSSGVNISDWSFERRLPVSWRSTFYVFALNEGYLENLLRFFISNPIKLAARWTRRLLLKPVWMGIAIGTTVLAVATIPQGGSSLGEAALGICMVLCSFTGFAERRSPARSWNFTAISHLAAGFFPYFEDRSLESSRVYLAGIVPAWLWGRFLLEQLRRSVPEGWNAKQFQGLVHVDPARCRALFLCVLALAAFPITPTFLGEDMLLHHCAGSSSWMAIPMALTFAVNGMTLLRLYSKVCLGSATQKSPEKEPSWVQIGLKGKAI